ncbi:hypothetical protein [Haloferax volcanii]|uniref:hypothetical protein n=1 Tax=Haloferax volcanii TaxID=2246 RepID=UPI003854C1E9
MSERTFRHASTLSDDARAESHRTDRPASESGDDADIDAADVQSRSARTNRWCPTIRQGIALWAIIAVGWAVIPADHPMQIAVAISGVYASLLLPTALYFDYRERRAESSAEGRARETAGALADRVRDALPGRGSSTRASSSCSCNR